LVEIALHLRDEEKFDMLAYLTAVDWPKREKRFDVVLDLYSFAKNERLRLKVRAADAEEVPSVVAFGPRRIGRNAKCLTCSELFFPGT